MASVTTRGALELIEKLPAHAKDTLGRILRGRRNKLWADTAIQLRVRSFPKIKHKEP